MGLVVSYKEKGLGVIVLNNPEGGNLLNEGFLNQFKQAFDQFKHSADVRAILYRSSESVFCLGMDLGKVSNTLEKKAEDARAAASGKSSVSWEIRKSIALYSDMVADIYECPKPVIAFVRGEVKAGGFGLACSADIVIATPEASFELSEVIFGLIPANVMLAVMGLRILPQRLKYLVLSSKRISAAEAYALGLVDEIVEKENAEKTLRDIVKRLFRSSPEALTETKRFTRVLLDTNMDKARSLAQERILGMLGEERVKEALAGFMEGEVPPWFASFKPGTSLTGL